MTALSVAGVFCIPRLQVQYAPKPEERSAVVSFSMKDASAETVEAEVTSKLEGILSRLRGVTDVSSISRKGGGSITLQFDRGTSMKKARLEMTSAIRNHYPDLPPGVSFPTVGLTSSGSGGRDVISLIYNLKGPVPTSDLERFARERLLPSLAAIPYVDGVRLSGATPYHWVITFDAAKARAAGLHSDEIAEAFLTATARNALGLVETSQGRMPVRLVGGSPEEGFGSFPIVTGKGTILYLQDLVSWQYRESEPQAYFRVNGLNTISLAITLTESSNLFVAVQAVKDQMRRLQVYFPREIEADLSYDSSDYIRAELHKIYIRTGLCLLILLLFVFLVSLSWRYLAVIVATVMVNILSALALYAVLGIPIHLYTLAGITVSMGLVIDTSIVMVDHYARWGNRRAFPSLLTATFTTVAALVMVFLLPEGERLKLSDFVQVVVLNLSLSLIVAYLFVPSLMELMPVFAGAKDVPVSRRRRLARWMRRYAACLAWGLRYRFLVYGFALALFGWSGYVFYKGLDRINFYREPERKQLVIQADMPEGCTVDQLNDVIKSMENYLAQYQEIETFVTIIDSSLSGTITVNFVPAWSSTGFPSQLKAKVIAAASNFGGASWSVYGVDDQSFSNLIVSTRKSDRIRLSGYNFKELMNYADGLIEEMADFPRIMGPEIWTAGSYSPPGTEYNLHYDYEKVAARGIDPFRYYGQLHSRLYNRPVGYWYDGGKGREEVVLRSSDTDRYDLWHMLHEPLLMDGRLITLSDVGTISKERTAIDIHRRNCVYLVDVCFDFMGQRMLEKRIVGGLVNHLNSEVLPVGYKAEWGSTSWFDLHKEDRKSVV